MATVAEKKLLGWGDEGEAWKWRGRLWAWEEEQLVECCALLHSIFLLDDVKDMWLLKLQA